MIGFKASVMNICVYVELFCLLVIFLHDNAPTVINIVLDESIIIVINDITELCIHCL